MDSKNNILQELQELNSRLAIAPSNPYTIPSGYFDGLLEQVMRRIKALEATDATEELGHLSPVLSRVSKQTPYTVPAGYFENAENRIAIATAGELSTKEELESISPLLSGLKKTNPYSIPEGYFENITVPAINKPAAKIVSLGSRKWFRLAAAAVVTGVVVLVGVMVLNTPQPKDPIAKVQKEIKKTSDKELTDFLEFTDETTSDVAINTDDAKDILKDIPEAELKAFLEETADGDTDVENSNLN